jgi:hypothetical protein
MGTIEQTTLETERLGLHKLSGEERLDMVSYDTEGNMHIKSICEDCQELLERNPDFHGQDYLIQ